MLGVLHATRELPVTRFRLNFGGRCRLGAAYVDNQAVNAVSLVNIVRLIERGDVSEEKLDRFLGSGRDGPLEKVQEHALERRIRQCAIRLLETSLQGLHIVLANGLIKLVEQGWRDA